MLEKDCSALILAGGRGNRMQTSSKQHTEKCLQQINSQTLAQISFNSLPNSIENVFISANTNQDKYQKYAKGIGEVVGDSEQYPSYSGPLAGIATALEKITTKWLYVMPADVVFTPDNLFQQLQNSIQKNNSNLAFAIYKNRAHPLFMLVNLSLLHDLKAYLLDGQRRVQAWVKQNGVACDVVPYPSFILADNVDYQENLFLNLNTPQDLLLAQSLVKKNTTS